jgi:hypothetical protein
MNKRFAEFCDGFREFALLRIREIRIPKNRKNHWGWALQITGRGEDC